MSAVGSKKTARGGDDTAIATQADQMPAFLGNTGKGNENVGTKDLTIPRLGMIQALSPELDSSSAKFIAGASQGMLFNSLTRELFSEVRLVNVFYRKEYPIFKKRIKGGGFIATFDNEADAQSHVNSRDDGADLEVVETAVHFCLLLDEGGESVVGEIAIPMSVTKLKVSRNWNSLIRLRGGDRYNSTWIMSTVKEVNKNNQPYYNYSVKAGPWINEAILEAAKNTYEAVVDGRRIVDRDDTADDAAPDTNKY